MEMCDAQFHDEMQRRSDVCEAQLRAFFDSVDVSKPFEPWKTERWQRRRDELIEDSCHLCGDTDDLQVHHEEHGPGWPSLWNTARDRLFFEEAYEPARYAPHKAVCPYCRNASYQGRVTKSPTYYCQNCSNEFDEPLLYPRQDSVEDDLWTDITEWTEASGEMITDRFEGLFWDEWEAYFEGEDTVTLCKGCHNRMHGGDHY